MTNNTFNEASLASILSALLPTVIQQISTSQPNMGIQSVFTASPNHMSSTSVSVPASQSAVTRAFAKVQCAASQGQFVAKPPGQAGRKVNGYNLQREMGFEGHFPHYKLVRTIVERACGPLNMALPYSKQNMEHIKIVLARARNKLPHWFSNYQDDWPLRAIIISYLKTHADKLKKLNQQAQASDDSWEANLPDPPAASGEDMAPQLPAVEGAGDSEVVHEALAQELQPDGQESTTDDSEPPSWLDPALFTTPSRPPNVPPVAPTATGPALPPPFPTGRNAERIEPNASSPGIDVVAQPPPSPTASIGRGGSDAMGSPERRRARPPNRKGAKSLGKNNLEFNARGLMAAVNQVLQAPASAPETTGTVNDPVPVAGNPAHKTASKRTRRSAPNEQSNARLTRGTKASGRQAVHRNTRARAPAV